MIKLNYKLVKSVTEFCDTSFVCCNGVCCCGDWSADYDIVRADFLCLCRSSNSDLVADIAVSKAYAGGNGNEAVAAFFVYLACFEG